MNGKCKYGSNCLYSHDITTTTTTSFITPSSHEKGELPSDVLVTLPILRGDGGEGMSGVEREAVWAMMEVVMDLLTLVTLI